MRLSRSPLISILIVASLFIAGITVFFLWVQGRPDSPTDLVAQVDAAPADSFVAQETAIPIPIQVPEMTIVEGEAILLNPVAGEMIQLAGNLPVPIVQPLPTQATENIVVEPAPEGDGVQPTLTPLAPLPTAEIIIPTITPLPLAAPVIAADNQVVSIIYASHQVAAGETLYSISRLYNSAVELLADKGISSANLIPGAIISVPYPNPAYCPNMTAYVVREKDTLFRIASVYGRSVEQLRATNINGIGPDNRINIGQVLCIP